MHKEYKHLEVSEAKWFTMTCEQRAKHLKKFEQTCVSDVKEADDQSTSKSNQSLTGNTSLSSNITCLSSCLNLPVEALEGISAKAKEFLTTEGAIAPAPGQDPDARMVLSWTGKRPHLVMPIKKGGFACDTECPQYVSSGICSHIVAAAEDNGKLESLVNALQKKKRLPNVTKLATSAVPRVEAEGV